MIRKSHGNLAMARADAVGLYCRHIQSMGAPLQRLLEQASIPAHLITVPNALVPLANAYHLAELACQALQTEHFGLHIGRTSSLQDLGVYGRGLGKAATIGAYLKQGVDDFNTLNSGERLWLSSHGPDLRLNHTTGSDHCLGAYQSQLFTMVLTVATLRKAIGSEWCPREVGFAYQSREPLPPAAEFSRSKIVQGGACSYLTIPRAFLRIPIHQAKLDTIPLSEEYRSPVPTELVHLVWAQVDALFADNPHLHIDTLAESLGMSRRSLQRAIDRQGVNYQELLKRYRMGKATGWLATRHKTITEIAVDLGYTDASNFARAFRRHTGCTPSEYRAGVSVYGGQFDSAIGMH